MRSFIVVDDEHLIREGIIKRIDMEGLSLACVGEAEDGQEALLLLQEKHPDIVLLDMKMPLMDGVELLRIIHNQHPRTKVIIISGHTDFEYTKKAIEYNVVGYLLKPFGSEQIQDLLCKAIAQLQIEDENTARVDTIIREKEKYRKSLDMQALANFITNPKGGDDAMLACRQILTSMLKSPCFSLGMVLAEHPLEEGLMEQCIAESGLSDICHLVAWSGNPRQALLLFSCEETTALVSLRLSSGQLYNSMQKNDVQRFFLCISGIRAHFQHLHQAYLECQSLFDSRECKCSEGLLHHSERTSSKPGLAWEDEDKLLFFIESGNKEQVTLQLNALFDRLNTTPDLTYRHIKDVYNDIFHDVIHLTETHGVAVSTTLFSDIARTFFEYADVDAIKRNLLDGLLAITDQFKEKHLYAQENMIDNMKRYIVNNYSKNLSLERIASLFFLNPTYCSYLFKTKAGENLSTFIAKVRIEKAKHLLRSTELSVQKISKAVGYENTNYFFRLFKSHTDCTPWEYRNS